MKEKMPKQKGIRKMNETYNVRDIVSEARHYFGVADRELDPNPKKAELIEKKLQKRVRRFLKEEWERTRIEGEDGRKKMFVVTKEERNKIVYEDLREYFKERLLSGEEKEAWEEKRASAQEDINKNNEWITSPQFMQDYEARANERHARLMGEIPRHELSDEEIEKMMLHALFHKAFPAFNLDSLRKEYAEYDILKQRLKGYREPDFETTNEMMRKNELEGRVMLALEGKNLSPYLEDKGEDNG